MNKELERALQVIEEIEQELEQNRKENFGKQAVKLVTGTINEQEEA